MGLGSPGLRVSGSRRRCRRMVGVGSRLTYQAPRRPSDPGASGAAPQAANPPTPGVSRAHNQLSGLRLPRAAFHRLPSMTTRRTSLQITAESRQDGTAILGHCFSTGKLRFCLPLLRAHATAGSITRNGQWDLLRRATPAQTSHLGNTTARRPRQAQAGSGWEHSEARMGSTAGT
jgi:hypothetical protein